MKTQKRFTLSEVRYCKKINFPEDELLYSHLLLAEPVQISFLARDRLTKKKIGYAKANNYSLRIKSFKSF